MAKKDNGIPTANVKDFLATIPKLPAVYDAKDFCNHPFTLTKIDWQIFAPSDRNNYNNSEKLKMLCITHSDGKEVILETTQKGITQIVGAIEAEGMFPCDLMIVQEGKYCTIVAV